MSVTCRDLVTGSIKLVSIPELYVRLNEAVEGGNASTTAIGHIISQDPGLTAHLLRIANSPLYGFSAKIDTISRAVMVIGTRGLRDLVLASSAVDVFSKIPSNLVSMASFWRHSIYAGVIARVMAEKCRVLHSERLFVSGLLHDIGQLILFYKLPELAREALYRSRSTGQPRYLAEQEVLGFDHAQVGGELLRHWNMPESLFTAVGRHHQPADTPSFPLETAIVHLADSLASTVEGNNVGDHVPPYCDPVAWDMIDLPADTTDAIMNEARPQFIAALSLFLPKTANAAA